jgi:hypothetical protein
MTFPGKRVKHLIVSGGLVGIGLDYSLHRDLLLRLRLLRLHLRLPR